jgi:hypothetical protein
MKGEVGVFLKYFFLMVALVIISVQLNHMEENFGRFSARVEMRLQDIYYMQKQQASERERPDAGALPAERTVSP